jgi:hypothetical protein
MKNFDTQCFIFAEAALEGTRLTRVRDIEKLADAIANTVEDFIDCEEGKIDDDEPAAP